MDELAAHATDVPYTECQHSPDFHISDRHAHADFVKAPAALVTGGGGGDKTFGDSG